MDARERSHRPHSGCEPAGKQHVSAAGHAGGNRPVDRLSRAALLHGIVNVEQNRHVRRPGVDIRRLLPTTATALMTGRVMARTTAVLGPVQLQRAKSDAARHVVDVVQRLIHEHADGRDVSGSADAISRALHVQRRGLLGRTRTRRRWRRHRRPPVRPEPRDPADLHEHGTPAISSRSARVRRS